MNKETLYTRTAALLGEAGVRRLQGSSVAVFGVGGVGGHAAEALVRAGIGSIALVDGDVFKESNLNRQIFAAGGTLGRNKAEAARERLLDINGAANITAYPFFFNGETKNEFNLKGFDYVVDAIDSVADKILLIKTAVENGARIISSMGAGGKIYADFKIGDIFETRGCPLARVMRRKLKEAGITRLKCVYSEEGGIGTAGSVSYVPGVCGLVMAGEVIRELCGI